MTDPTAGASRKSTHAKNRQRLGRRLRKMGVPEAEVQAILARRAADQRLQREIERKNAAPSEVDDKGYRPASVDPLLKGVGRVSGQTAKAVKRTKALTRTEHQEAERGR